MKEEYIELIIALLLRCEDTTLLDLIYKLLLPES